MPHTKRMRLVLAGLAGFAGSALIGVAGANAAPLSQQGAAHQHIAHQFSAPQYSVIHHRAAPAKLHPIKLKRAAPIRAGHRLNRRRAASPYLYAGRPPVYGRRGLRTAKRLRAPINRKAFVGPGGRTVVVKPGLRARRSVHAPYRDQRRPRINRR